MPIDPKLATLSSLGVPHRRSQRHNHQKKTPSSPPASNRLLLRRAATHPPPAEERPPGEGGARPATCGSQWCPSGKGLDPRVEADPARSPSRISQVAGVRLVLPDCSAGCLRLKPHPPTPVFNRYPFNIVYSLYCTTCFFYLSL